MNDNERIRMATEELSADIPNRKLPPCYWASAAEAAERQERRALAATFYREAVEASVTTETRGHYTKLMSQATDSLMEALHDRAGEN